MDNLQNFRKISPKTWKKKVEIVKNFIFHFIISFVSQVAAAVRGSTWLAQQLSGIEADCIWREALEAGLETAEMKPEFKESIMIGSADSAEPDDSCGLRGFLYDQKL